MIARGAMSSVTRDQTATHVDRADWYDPGGS